MAGITDINNMTGPLGFNLESYEEKWGPKQDLIDEARAEAEAQGLKYIGDANTWERIKEDIKQVPDAVANYALGSAAGISELLVGLGLATWKGAQMATTTDPERLEKLSKEPAFTKYLGKIEEAIPTVDLVKQELSGLDAGEMYKKLGYYTGPPSTLLAAPFKAAKLLKTQNIAEAGKFTKVGQPIRNTDALNDFISGKISHKDYLHIVRGKPKGAPWTSKDKRFIVSELDEVKKRLYKNQDVKLSKKTAAPIMTTKEERRIHKIKQHQAGVYATPEAKAAHTQAMQETTNQQIKTHIAAGTPIEEIANPIVRRHVDFYTNKTEFGAIPVVTKNNPSASLITSKLLKNSGIKEIRAFPEFDTKYALRASGSDFEKAQIKNIKNRFEKVPYDIDHVKGLLFGGTNTTDNFQPILRSAHMIADVPAETIGLMGDVYRSKSVMESVVHKKYIALVKAIKKGNMKKAQELSNEANKIIDTAINKKVSFRFEIGDPYRPYKTGKQNIEFLNEVNLHLTPEQVEVARKLIRYEKYTPDHLKNIPEGPNRFGTELAQMNERIGELESIGAIASKKKTGLPETDIQMAESWNHGGIVGISHLTRHL